MFHQRQVFTIYEVGRQAWLLLRRDHFLASTITESMLFSTFADCFEALTYLYPLRLALHASVMAVSM